MLHITVFSHCVEKYICFIARKKKIAKILVREMRDTAVYMRIARDDPCVHCLQIRYDFPRNSDSQTRWLAFTRYALESSIKIALRNLPAEFPRYCIRVIGVYLYKTPRGDRLGQALDERDITILRVTKTRQR